MDSVKRGHAMDFVLGPFTRDMVTSYTQGTVAIIPALLSLLRLPLNLQTGRPSVADESEKFYSHIDTLHLLVDKLDFGIYTSVLPQATADLFKTLETIICTTIRSQLDLDKSSHSITVRIITDLAETTTAPLPAATIIQLHPYITITALDMATMLQDVISDSSQYLSNAEKTSVTHAYMPTLAVSAVSEVNWYFFFVYILHLFYTVVDAIPIVRYALRWLFWFTASSSEVPAHIMPHSVVYIRVMDEQLEMLKRYLPISSNPSLAAAAFVKAADQRKGRSQRLFSVYPSATTTESALLLLTGTAYVLLSILFSCIYLFILGILVFVRCDSTSKYLCHCIVNKKRLYFKQNVISASCFYFVLFVIYYESTQEMVKFFSLFSCRCLVNPSRA